MFDVLALKKKRNGRSSPREARVYLRVHTIDASRVTKENKKKTPRGAPPKIRNLRKEDQRRTNFELNDFCTVFVLLTTSS